MRADVDSLTAPISVTFNPFYITLNVARSNGARRAVASIVLQAAPPADRLTQSVEDRLAPAQGVASYSFAPPESVRAGPVVLVSDLPSNVLESRARSAGADAFVRKMSDGAAFVEFVRNICAIAYSPDALPVLSDPAPT